MIKTSYCCGPGARREQFLDRLERFLGRTGADLAPETKELAIRYVEGTDFIPVFRLDGGLTLIWDVNRQIVEVSLGGADLPTPAEIQERINKLRYKQYSCE